MTLAETGGAPTKDQKIGYVGSRFCGVPAEESIKKGVGRDPSGYSNIEEGDLLIKWFKGVGESMGFLGKGFQRGLLRGLSKTKSGLPLRKGKGSSTLGEVPIGSRKKSPSTLPRWKGKEGGHQKKKFDPRDDISSQKGLVVGESQQNWSTLT